MSMIKCPTGWIVVPSESGDGYVPFFVHVRQKDIHWKHDPVLQTIIDKNVDTPNDVMTHLNPGCSFRIMKNNWAIEIQCDGLVTATTQLSINDKFNYIDDTHMGISGYIDLPLFVKNDSFFNIQLTMAPNNAILQKSSIYVNKINAYETIGKEDIQGHRMFKLNIVSQAQEFSNNFVVDCANSVIFVTVRGMLPFYEYKENM